METYIVLSVDVVTAYCVLHLVDVRIGKISSILKVWHVLYSML